MKYRLREGDSVRHSELRFERVGTVERVIYAGGTLRMVRVYWLGSDITPAYRRWEPPQILEIIR